MIKQICRVLAQTPVEYVPCSKSEDGQVARSFIRLQPLGCFSEELVCVMLGNLALTKFEKGQLVAAALSFKAHETEKGCFQSVIATDVAHI